MTPEQEAAVERVREYLNTADKGESEMIAVQLYIWMAGTRTYRNSRGEQVIEPTGEHSEKLVEAAGKDPAAWEAARMLVAGLSENGEQLPPALRKFTAEMMRGKRSEPNNGRPKKLARDLYIANAVYMLLKAGIQKNQNDSIAEPRSAFAFVAEHSSLSRGAVKTIWKNLGEHVEATRRNGPYYFLEDGLKLKL